MYYKTITLEEIRLIGIEARTSNDDASDEIPHLWEQFFTENIKDKIPNKISADILSLYTEYESDYTKPYTIVLGCKVRDFSDVPEGMVSKIIPSSKFAVFTAKGKMPDELVNTWQYIWDSDLERTYTGDFDEYTEKYSSEVPEANVYVAIK